MIQFKKLHKDAKIPARQTDGAAGFDIFSNEIAAVSFGSVAIISTGIAVKIPDGYVGIIKPRSGLAVRHGVDTMAGVIDSDYRGEIKVLLTKHSEDHELEFYAGERVAQLVVVPFLGDAKEVDNLDDTERGSSGFGSTGTA